ncbi:hypothetical protein ACF3M1_10805 [Luteimonas sp. WGS1318]|uniref:hypothetical protein n=1 Tax=Luteimonas sp. WGS1318 TaxID=3366815 RepID=UPI00372CE9A3
MTTATTNETRLVYTPHPVTCEGQTNQVAEMLPGEKLGPFLRRTVDGWADDMWEVRIEGVFVPHQIMDRVRPKDGTLIEVRGVAKKQALYIIAFAALTYFTFGLGTAAAGGWAGVGAAVGGGFAGAALSVAVYAAGPAIGGKVIR